MFARFSVIQCWKTHNTSFNYLKSMHCYYENYYGFLTPLLVSWLRSYLIISMIDRCDIQYSTTRITSYSFLILFTPSLQKLLWIPYSTLSIDGQISFYISMIVSFSVIQWWKTHNTSFNILKMIHRNYKNYYGFGTPVLVSLLSSFLLISMIDIFRDIQYSVTRIT
jgi:hypothetical protein